MWYLDSTQIVLQKESAKQAQILARLQPVSGPTIIQVFGYESPIRNLEGIVVGTADRDSIKSKIKDGSAHSLSGPDGTYISGFYLSSFDYDRMESIKQTIRTDLAEDAPVYKVKIETNE